MTLAGFLIFVTVYALAVASPGPAVAAIVARSLASGFRATAPFIAGVTIGDFVWFALTALGLALVAERFQTLFAAVKFAGVAWLCLLAWRAWTAPVADGAPRPPPRAGGEGARLFLGGLALTLGNPKTMVFFLAILPNLIDMRHLDAMTLGVASLTILIVLPAVMSAYALAADRARRLVASAAAMRRLNRATALVMAGAAAAVATR